MFYSFFVIKFLSLKDFKTVFCPKKQFEYIKIWVYKIVNINIV